MNLTDVPVIHTTPLFSSDNLFLMNVIQLILIFLVFHLTLSILALLMHIYLYLQVASYCKKFVSPNLNFNLERKLWPSLNFLFKLKLTIDKEEYYLQHDANSLTNIEKIFYQKKYLNSLTHQQYLGLGEISLFLNKFKLKNFMLSDISSYQLFSLKSKKFLPITFLVEKNKP